MKPAPATERLTRRTVIESIAGTGVAATTVDRVRDPGSLQADGLEVVGEAAVEGAREVVVRGDLAYVATTGVREADDGPERFGGLAVVDLDPPDEPTVLDRVELPADEFPMPDTADVKVEGNVAALADDSSFPYPGGVVFFDVSDPTDVERLSVYHPNAAIHNLFLDDSFAYLCINEPTWIDADERPTVDRARPFGETGIEIVDVSNPAHPGRVARWQLKDELPAHADAGVNNSHDLFVQDGLAYVAYWDVGVLVLDVGRPSEPELVARFGTAPEADEPIPPLVLGEAQEYFETVFPRERFHSLPGNVHYVQPSPDGDSLYAGAEAFLGDPGGIDVWDVSDLDDPERVARIDPPSGGEQIDPSGETEVDERQRLLRTHTSHNFDVTDEELHTSWYGGGVRVFDVSDPTDPTELASFDREDSTFWTAVAAGEYTVAGDIDRGVVVLGRAGARGG